MNNVLLEGWPEGVAGPRMYPSGRKNVIRRASRRIRARFDGRARVAMTADQAAAATAARVVGDGRAAALPFDNNVRNTLIERVASNYSNLLSGATR